MARRSPTLELQPIVEGLTTSVTLDKTDKLLLSATNELLRTLGLRRWSMDDVADKAGVGRTTVYRRYASRDDLVTATIVYECQQFFAHIAASVDPDDDLTDRVINGFLLGISLVRGSVLHDLFRNDRDVLYRLVTTDGELLLATARNSLAELALIDFADNQRDDALIVTELLLRWALSLLLFPSSTTNWDDPEQARHAVTMVVRALLQRTLH